MRRGERGVNSVEAMLVVPLLVVMIGVMAAAGRIALAKIAVADAAGAAARAASIERSAGAAQTAATQVARASLQGGAAPCVPQVQLVADFTTPVGTSAQARATVTCTVRLGDLGVPGLPGTQTFSETRSSVIDSYRERRR